MSSIDWIERLQKAGAIADIANLQRVFGNPLIVEDPIDHFRAFGIHLQKVLDVPVTELVDERPLQDELVVVRIVVFDVMRRKGRIVVIELVDAFVVEVDGDVIRGDELRIRYVAMVGGNGSQRVDVDPKIGSARDGNIDVCRLGAARKDA